MSEEKEAIKHAAVIAKDGRFLIGKSHADCFRQAMNIGVETHSGANCQGFVTSKGRFVDRKEAALIAIEAGQVRGGVEILFSEDLWSPTADGQFEYDYVKGYFWGMGRTMINQNRCGTTKEVMIEARITTPSQGVIIDRYYKAIKTLRRLEKLSEAVEESYPDETLIRCEVTAGDIREIMRCLYPTPSPRRREDE